MAGWLAALWLVVAPLGVEATDVQRPVTGLADDVQVSEVALDALVTDRRGNVVVGLDKDDFEVFEDGDPVELTGVTFYSNRELLESSEQAKRLGVDPDEVPSERYFVLFFHDQRQQLARLAGQQMDAGRWAERWVRSDLLPNDYVAVVSYDYTLRVHQDFTNDHAAAAREIKNAVISRGGGGSQEAQGNGPSLVTNLPAGEALQQATGEIYDALEVLAQALDEIPGRKNLALFSIGFGDSGPFGFYTPDTRRYPQLLYDLNNANVAVYAVDLIPTSAPGGLRGRVLNNSLSYLATETGGEYFYNFVNFRTPLENMAEETSGYYLLTYRSAHPAGEEGYQEVTVQTVDRSLDVRTRSGYLWGE
ncbi:MAG: VWA domain-containing protein [Acidobacteriota bacterium]|nr:VWA domain-containing protein [Acidobacteriota bacterium]